MASKVYTVEAPNGEVIKFEWSGSEPPTQKDLEEVFVAAGKWRPDEPQEKPEPRDEKPTRQSRDSRRSAGGAKDGLNPYVEEEQVSPGRLLELSKGVGAGVVGSFGEAAGGLLEAVGEGHARGDKKKYSGGNFMFSPDDTVAQETPEERAVRSERGQAIAEYGRGVAQKSREFSEEYMPEFENDTDRAVFSGFISVGSNIPWLALGPAGLLGMSAQAGLASYSQAKARGASHEDAANFGFRQMLIEGATEALPFSFILKLGGKKFAKAFLGEVVTDMAGENVAEALGAVNELLLENPNASKEDVIKAVKGADYYQASVASITSSLAFGALGGARNIAKNNKQLTKQIKDRNARDEFIKMFTDDTLFRDGGATETAQNDIPWRRKVAETDEAAATRERAEAAEEVEEDDSIEAEDATPEPTPTAEEILNDPAVRAMAEELGIDYDELVFMSTDAENQRSSPPLQDPEKAESAPGVKPPAQAEPTTTDELNPHAQKAEPTQDQGSTQGQQEKVDDADLLTDRDAAIANVRELISNRDEAVELGAMDLAQSTDAIISYLSGVHNITQEDINNSAKAEPKSAPKAEPGQAKGKKRTEANEDPADKSARTKNKSKRQQLKAERLKLIEENNKALAKKLEVDKQRNLLIAQRQEARNFIEKLLQQRQEAVSNGDINAATKAEQAILKVAERYGIKKPNFTKEKAEAPKAKAKPAEAAKPKKEKAAEQPAAKASKAETPPAAKAKSKAKPEKPQAKKPKADSTTSDKVPKEAKSLINGLLQQRQNAIERGDLSAAVEIEDAILDVVEKFGVEIPDAIKRSKPTKKKEPEPEPETGKKGKKIIVTGKPAAKPAPEPVAEKDKEVPVHKVKREAPAKGKAAKPRVAKVDKNVPLHEMTLDEYAEADLGPAKNHHDAVKKAIDEGVDVRADVLADYPGLRMLKEERSRGDAGSKPKGEKRVGRKPKETPDPAAQYETIEEFEESGDNEELSEGDYITIDGEGFTMVKTEDGDLIPRSGTPEQIAQEEADLKGMGLGHGRGEHVLKLSNIPAVKTAVFAAVKSQTVKQRADAIRHYKESLGGDTLPELAKEVLGKLLDALADANIWGTSRLTVVEIDASDAMWDELPGKNGFYSPNHNAIVIKKGAGSKVYNHELLHAAFYAMPKEKRDEMFSKMAGELVKIRRHMISHGEVYLTQSGKPRPVDESGDTDAEAIAAFVELWANENGVTDKDIIYELTQGVVNADEMIAELGNPYFAKMINEVIGGKITATGKLKGSHPLKVFANGIIEWAQKKFGLFRRELKLGDNAVETTVKQIIEHHLKTAEKEGSKSTFEPTDPLSGGPVLGRATAPPPTMPQSGGNPNKSIFVPERTPPPPTGKKPKNPKPFLNLGAAKKVVKSLGEKARAGMRSRGGLPEIIHNLNIKKNSWINARLKRMEMNLKDLDSAVSKMLKANPTIDKETLSERVNTALQMAPSQMVRHYSDQEISPALKLAIAKARTNIDALTTYMKRAGMLNGPLSIVADVNLGSYIHRGYEIFDNPNYVEEKITPKVKAAAIAQIKKDYTDPKTGNPPSQKFIDEIYDLLITKPSMAEMKKLGNGNVPLGFIKHKLGQKKLDVLMKRKEIPQAYRDLWGEYKDPAMNYAASVTNMVFLAANHQFLNAARKAGLREGFMSEKISRKKGFIIQIASEGSKTLEPLNGIYTTPEINQALIDAVGISDEYRNAILEAVLTINNVAKVSKTILSPVTHTRNLVSNLGFALQNGLVTPYNIVNGDAIKEFAASARLAFLGDKTFTPEHVRALLIELTELGVLYESATAGELADIRKELSRAIPISKLGDGAKFISDAAGKGFEIARGLYVSEDNLWKMFHFLGESKRYKEALLKDPRYSKMKPDDFNKVVKQKAAKIVRRTHPTYSLIPPFLKALRKNPWIAPFVAFPAEAIRVTYGSLMQGVEEIHSKNRHIKAIGVKRLSSMIATHGLFLAATYISKNIFDVDDEEEEALRVLLPEWSKNSPLFFFGRDEKGVPRFVDLAYSDAFAIMHKPLIAAFKALEKADNKSEDDYDTVTEELVNGAREALGELLDPFISAELPVAAFINIVANEDDYERLLYAPGEFTRSALSVIADQFLGIGGENSEMLFTNPSAVLLPGAIVTGRRIQMGLRDKTEETGRKYSAKEEIIALVSGQRMAGLDPLQAVTSKLATAKDRIDSMIPANRKVYQKGTSINNKIRALAQGDEFTARSINDAFEAVVAAMRLGVSEEDIVLAAKRVQLRDDEIAAIMVGIPEIRRQAGDDYPNFVSSRRAILRQRAKLGFYSGKTMEELESQGFEEEEFEEEDE